MMNFIILLGPPGSGKGTQALLLKERMGYVLLSTGDLLRDEIKRETAFGLKASEYINKGLLVPDELITGFILDYIERNKLYSENILLDGFPRRISQAEALSVSMKNSDKKVDAALLLALDRDDIMYRLSGRKMCPKCQSIYHADAGDKCEKCQTALVKRTDDNEETIIKRIDVYENETAPLIDYYKKNGLLHCVNGKGTVEEVYERIVKAVKNNG